MMATPKISVIVPAYNVEQYIAECLESLQRQSFSDFEVIVVDDESTDSTLDRARAIVNDDPRFTFIRQAHGGQSAARNIGLDTARGEYVSFLDADDYLVPECLQKLYDAAAADNLECVFFSAESFYDGIDVADSLVEELEHTVDAPGVLTGPELFEAFEFSDDIWCPVVLQFIRRSAIEQRHLRFREGIIHEDELFTAISLPQMERVALLKQVLYKRRIRPKSTMTGSESFAHATSLFRVSYEMKRWLANTDFDFSRPFIRAFAHRVYWLTDIAARYALDEEMADLRRFADTLTDVELFDFEMNIVQRSANTKKISDEISGTKAYRLGHALAAIPESIVDTIRLRSRRR